MFQRLPVVLSHILIYEVDHAKYIKEYEQAGFTVLKPYEEPFTRHYLGGFEIYTFPLKHNVPCYGFYIKHEDMHSLLYITDTCYVAQNFQKLEPRHLLFECNYQKDMVDMQLYKYEHELRDHMERDTCIDFIKANRSYKMENVILCHLSQSAIDEQETLEKAKQVAFCDTYIATPGLSVEIKDGDVCPFA